VKDAGPFYETMTDDVPPPTVDDVFGPTEDDATLAACLSDLSDEDLARELASVDGVSLPEAETRVGRDREAAAARVMRRWLP
jgi:hypothetical protein